nr:reverse transcriptase domain-containing protein [Tanacetum cinerariifolium]
MNEANIKAMQTQINNMKNELRNEMKNSIQAFMSNQTNELKNMMASFFQMNTASTSGSGPLPRNTITNPKGELKAITTHSGIVLDGPFVPIPPPFINPEDDERVDETLTNQDLAEYTIKVPHPLVQKPKPPSQRNFVMHQRDPLHPNIPYPSRMHKQKQQEKDESPLILGRPFLHTARALIDVHREEMILRNGDERLTLNTRHDTLSYSNQPEKESINMINIYDDSSEDFLKDLFATNHQSGNPTLPSHSDLTLLEVKDDIFEPKGDNVLIEKLINLDSTKDLPPPHNINRNDDLLFDIESDLKEIEYLLNHDPIKEMDYILEDLVDEDNLADLNDNLVDTMPKMFTDEHALDYSSPPLYDEYDDLFEVESNTEYVYDDPFDSMREKIKESKLLIDELDLPRSSDFLPSPDYESFLLEDFSEVDALPSTDNEDKVFNLGILIPKNLFEVITRVAPDKNVK